MPKVLDRCDSKNSNGLEQKYQSSNTRTKKNKNGTNEKEDRVNAVDGTDERPESDDVTAHTDDEDTVPASDAVDADVNERSILSNNFILPMESVETLESREMEAALKKHKQEKKDGRLYKFVKKHFLQRKNSSNDVQEIRIVPEGDELKWARRSAGSAASRSSNETTGSDIDRLEVVHDMAEEYVPEV